jgi:hypothetical protein
MQAKTKASLRTRDQVEDSQRYYVPPPDTANAGSVNVRMDLDETARIQKVLQSKLFPFSNQSDLIRAAVHWFLVQISDRMDERFQDDLRLAERLMAAARETKRLIDMDKVVTTAIRVIHFAFSKGHYEIAREEYDNLLTFVSCLSDKNRAVAEGVMRRSEVLRRVLPGLEN